MNRATSLLRKAVGVTRPKLTMATPLRAMSSGSVDSFTFPIRVPYELHNLEGVELPTEVTATKEELFEYLELMTRMRRMEITCDNEYKARTIRGFCHLYDGQEAVATGVEAGLTREDSWITSYRCHCTMLARGGNVQEILEELFGFSGGVVKGKGGSMHMYNKENNFYGGQGIVGAQVPVGAGLAFAAQYKAKLEGADKSNVAIAMYGDGAANQGQIWEAANMSALWKLPMIFCIENNRYGMGTSAERHSSNVDYYKMGNYIPGIKIDGMDVLAVREGLKWAKEYCGSGNGPLYIEMSTYRYHGHSMSDPGITYRDRSEVAETRSSRDPIENLKNRLIESGMSTVDEIKLLEKRVRSEVAAAAKVAKAGKEPPVEELVSDIYMSADGKNEYPPYIRMPNFGNSQYHS